MGRTHRFNKKDGRGSNKPRTKSSRKKKKRDLGRGIRSQDYDMGGERFERFHSNGKSRKS
jgi:hypothetical protein